MRQPSRARRVPRVRRGRQDRPDRQDRQQTGWAVQVASVNPRRRSAAQTLVGELAADGYPAFLLRRGDWLLICVGPYNSRSDAILGAMTERFPDSRPSWRRID